MSDDDAHPGEPPAAGSEAGSAPSEVRSFLELLAVASLAFTQPVLSVFGANPGVFVSAGAGRRHILAFVLGLVLVPPSVLWCSERAIGALVPRSRRWFHLLALGGMAAVFFAQLARQVLGVAPPAMAVLGAVLGVAAAVLMATATPFRTFVGHLAWSPLLFVALLLGATPVRTLAFADVPGPLGPERNRDLPPVVMIVLDELPAASLLDGDGAIDVDAFPGLGGLAADATFLRNHTSVAPNTPVAVPAILTGRWPTAERTLPTAHHHGENLFTLLAHDYDLHVIESVTQLCPPTLCSPPRALLGRAHPLAALAGEALTVLRRGEVDFDVGLSDDEAELSFDAMAATFDPRSDRPGLHYLHVLLPHQDWTRLPDGSRHDGPNPPRGVHGGTLPEDPQLAEIARQRHLMQLAFTDSLVARLLDELRSKGMYDESLIVVTADHGVSFQPGEQLRPITQGNAADVLWTPLLIKEPHQQSARVLDAPVAAVDVLPTIVDLLGISAPWEMDGRTVFAEERPADWSRRSYPWSLDLAEPGSDGFVHVDGEEGFERLLRTRALDHGPQWDLRFWRRGPHGDLVARRLDSIGVGPPAGYTVQLDDPDRFLDVDLTAARVPSYISGSVRDAGRVDVAIAVNGVVGGWYAVGAHEPAGGGASSGRFDVIVPPSLLRDGRNDVEVFVIEGRGDDRTLAPVAARTS